MPAPSMSYKALPIDAVYYLVGFGWYQWMLFLICGLGYCMDSVQTGLIYFLHDAVAQEWPHVEGIEQNFVVMGVFVGQLLGGGIWGPLADRYGRRKTFLLSNILLLLFGGLSALVQTYWQFVAARVLVGVCIGGIVIPVETLAESVDETRAQQFAFALNYWWSFGTIYVNGCAALVLDGIGVSGWRLLVGVSTIPILLPCLGFFLLEESPMWLLDQGRVQDALAVLQRMANTNGNDISDVSLIPHRRHSEASVSELFSRSLRVRTLTFAVIWFLMAFGYFGASLASPYIFATESGETNYASMFFACSGEFLGVAVGSVALKVLGPMFTQTFLYTIGAVTCLSITLKDVMPRGILIICDFFLRMAMMGGSCIVFTATPLAFPTHVRSTAHGFQYAVGRLGCILASSWPASTPLCVLLVTYASANSVSAVVPAVGHTLGRVPEENKPDQKYRLLESDM